MDSDPAVSLRIRELLITGLGLGYLGDKLTEDLPLLSSGLVDSYGLQELSSFLASEFGIVVADRELWQGNFETIASMARFVCLARSGGHCQSPTEQRSSNSPGT